MVQVEIVFKGAKDLCGINRNCSKGAKDLI